MTQPIKLSAMLAVTGGLAAATLPTTARADCGAGATASAPHAAPSASAATGPGFDLQERYKEGAAAFEAGNFRASKIAFESLMPYTPKVAPVYYLAGASRMKLADYKGARRHLEKALKLMPDLLVAKMDLGVTYTKLGERALAEKMLGDLQARQTACAGTCEEAEPLAGAIETIKAAMA